MRKWLLLFFIFNNTVFAQAPDRNFISNISLNGILNAPIKSVTLSQLKGKFVLIEFWATWCEPCLKDMPRLNELQLKYAGRLQVITVTRESPARVKLYLNNRPSNLWFVTDTNGSISNNFPHQIIPHAVLISPENHLIATTKSSSVTDKVIDSLIDKRKIHLPEKKDNQLDSKELIKKYFFAADTVKNRFMIISELKGSPSLSTMYLTDSIFCERRFSCFNLSLTTLYMIAYGNLSHRRVANGIDTDDKGSKYCLDLIVKNKTELLPYLKNELSKRFNIKTEIRSEIKDAFALKIIDPEKFKTIPRNESGKRTYGAGLGVINQTSITMADFARYLEDYGAGQITIDETNSVEKFDLKFSFQPENPESLTRALDNMGLGLVKEKHKVNMLYFERSKNL